MENKLITSPLFSGISREEIPVCLDLIKGEVFSYHKEDLIFNQGDKPKKLFILLEGSVSICRDSFSGKRNITTSINRGGDLFGEVFLFLEKQEYDNYAVANKASKIMQIPKETLFGNPNDKSKFHPILMRNMLTIFAEKAYYLNRKLSIVSSPTLRQKIIKFLVNNANSDAVVNLKMNREELADYLNVTRPSLSRELMNMKKSGLISIKNTKTISINLEAMQGEL